MDLDHNEQQMELAKELYRTTKNSDKPACVSEIGGSDTQHHLEYIKRYQKWRRGEDKTMSEMGLTPKQIGEALDWLIGVAENHIADAGKMVGSDHIADMRKKVGLDHIPDAGQMINLSLSVDTKETQTLLQSYLDNLKDWQLVPIEPTPEMIQAATSSDEEYSKRSFGGGVHLCQGGYDHYLVMLAAAPKYTGEK